MGLEACAKVSFMQGEHSYVALQHNKHKSLFFTALKYLNSFNKWHLL